YRAEMAELRKLIDAGRLQAGFGDQRFVEDAQVRAAFREALMEETRRAAAGEGGREAAEFAQRVMPLLQRADAAERQLQKLYEDLEARARIRSDELRNLIEVETANLLQYAERLDELDAEARVVVGEVAMRNFALVRDRLKDI